MWLHAQISHISVHAKFAYASICAFMYTALPDDAPVCYDLASALCSSVHKSQHLSNSWQLKACEVHHVAIYVDFVDLEIRVSAQEVQSGPKAG